MIGGGKIVGIVLMILSVLLFVGFLAWTLSEEITGGGRTLGLLLAGIILAPIFGIGVYVFSKGSSEVREFAVVEKEKKLLNMVLTQGQVNLGELVGELEMPREAVEDMIRSVVGKQLFSGAIDWKKGVLYSVESQQLTDGRKCPNCGSELSFAGKGLITCTYCGSDVFLTKRAAASTAA